MVQLSPASGWHPLAHNQQNCSVMNDDRICLKKKKRNVEEF